MKIVVTSPSFSKNKYLRDYLRSKLKNISVVKFNIEGEKLTGESLINFIDDYDVVISGLERFDKSIFLACPNLRVISKYGVGTDNINFEDCKKYNVKILTSSGINKLSVAEHTLTSLLYLAHNFGPSSRDLVEGRWIKNGGKQLSGKTVGIIGLGNIGKELTRLINPFNCRLIYTDPVRDLDFESTTNIEFFNLGSLLQHSDFITLHASLNEKSRGIIGFNEFKVMKSGVFVVNTARSELISQDALKAALNEPGKIGGIAIDVFHNEPFVEEYLLTNKYVLPTPHIAGNTEEAVKSMGKAAVDNLVKFKR